MKKTFTINLNNTVYHVDDDAYDLLRKYLNDVESRLSSNERKEVMGDIEARISELFAERLQRGRNVITIKDVEEIIGILGKPNQFSEEDTSEQETTNSKSGKKHKRKFYRDPENAVFGGVAAGLAAWLGWDMVWVRVLLVVIVFLGYGTIIPIYFIVWLIAPAARTIAQRLEMQGEDVTAERIKAEINNLKSYMESEKFQESATGVGNKLGEIFGVFFKIIFGFIGVVMGLVGFIMLGVLIFSLSIIIFEPSIFSGFIPEIGLVTPHKAVLMIIALLFIVGIPIFMIISWAIRTIAGKNRKTGAAGWVMPIIWVLSILIFTGLSAKMLSSISKADLERFDLYWLIDDDEGRVDEMRDFEPFHSIEVGGNIEVELIQDSIQSVQVSAQPKVLSQVITKVENGILKIDIKKIHRIRSVKVKISINQLQSLVAQGATIIESNGVLTTDHLRIQLSGVSKVELDVAVSQLLTINMDGATNAEINGFANKLSADVSGVSKLDTDNLLARNAVINGSGVSKIEVNVKDSLEVEMSGASSLQMKNKPAFLQKQVSGTSSVKID